MKSGYLLLFLSSLLAVPAPATATGSETGRDGQRRITNGVVNPELARRTYSGNFRLPPTGAVHSDARSIATVRVSCVPGETPDSPFIDFVPYIGPGADQFIYW